MFCSDQSGQNEKERAQKRFSCLLLDRGEKRKRKEARKGLGQNSSPKRKRPGPGPERYPTFSVRSDDGVGEADRLAIDLETAALLTRARGVKHHVADDAFIQRVVVGIAIGQTHHH